MSMCKLIWKAETALVGCGADIKYKMNYNISISCIKSASAAVVSYVQNKPESPVNCNLSQNPV